MPPVSLLSTLSPPLWLGGVLPYCLGGTCLGSSFSDICDIAGILIEVGKSSGREPTSNTGMCNLRKQSEGYAAPPRSFPTEAQSHRHENLGGRYWPGVHATLSEATREVPRSQ